MARSSLKAEHVEATRKALIKAARKLFAADGYANVSTEQIVRAARVTRGALYHHFEDKRALFGAVAEQIGVEMKESVARAAMTAPSVFDGLLAGMNAFLDACLQRDVYRIIVLDGASVLGWQEWRANDQDHALTLLGFGLQSAMDVGVIEPQPVRTLAALLLGAMNEGAMIIAVADDHEAARREVGASLERLLQGLRTDRS